MALLYLDGVDDKLVIPAFSHDKVVIEMGIFGDDSNYDCLISTYSYYYRWDNYYMESAYSGINSILMDGSAIAQADFGFYAANYSRAVYTLNVTTNNYAVNIFSSGSDQYTSGNIYNIKFYSGATLVAHYDMNTGTVQDQSGNGRHATLTGGTWQGVVQTGTSYTKSLTDALSLTDSKSVLYTPGASQAYTKSLSDSIVLSDSLSKRQSRYKTLTDSMGSTDTLSKQAARFKNLTDSLGITDSLGNKAAQKKLTDSVGTTESLSKQAARYKTLTDALTLLETFSTGGTRSFSKLLNDSLSMSDSTGKAVLRKIQDAVLGSDSVKKAVNKARADGITLSEPFIYSDRIVLTDLLTTRTNIDVRLFDVVVTSDELKKYDPNAPVLIGTIPLKGTQNLYVYLQGVQGLEQKLRGEQILTVNLKGVIS